MKPSNENKTCTWRFMAMLLMMVFLAGCTTFFSGADRRKGVSGSVVDYLYPAGKPFEPAVEGTPEVRLPARVGLMFVPSAWPPEGVSAAQQQALLEAVRDAFHKQEFIQRIEIVPQSYLRRAGGFENLEQVARMHGVDLVALVAYDQMLSNDDTAASFLYWTIVGAYTVRASKNDVSTFVETAVFDVASRSLLLRAPGHDQRQGSSTAVRIRETRERLANESFSAAMTQMIGNLDQAIADFDRRVREEGQVRLVERNTGTDWHRRSGGGGGAVAAWELALLLLGAALLWVKRRQ